MTLVFSQGGGSTSSRLFTRSSDFLKSARALRQDAHVSRCASMRFFSASGKCAVDHAGEQVFNLFARHGQSPRTLTRQSFMAALALKSLDFTVPSGSFSNSPISS